MTRYNDHDEKRDSEPAKKGKPVRNTSQSPASQPRGAEDVSPSGDEGRREPAREQPDSEQQISEQPAPEQQEPASQEPEQRERKRTTRASKQRSERKERVLHTRVPAVLEQELKHLAESLRMPVSNVVRAILEDAVTAVDRVGRKAEGEMNRVVDRMAEKREQLRNIAARKNQEEKAADDPSDQGSEPEESTEEPPEAARSERNQTAVLEGVIGFQPLILASSTACSICGKPLRAGANAFVGVGDGQGPRVLIGPECLPDWGKDP